MLTEVGRTRPPHRRRAVSLKPAFLAAECRPGGIRSAADGELAPEPDERRPGDAVDGPNPPRTAETPTATAAPETSNPTTILAAVAAASRRLRVSAARRTS